MQIKIMGVSKKFKWHAGGMQMKKVENPWSKGLIGFYTNLPKSKDINKYQFFVIIMFFLVWHFSLALELSPRFSEIQKNNKKKIFMHITQL